MLTYIKQDIRVKENKGEKLKNSYNIKYLITNKKYDKAIQKLS